MSKEEQQPVIPDDEWQDSTEDGLESSISGAPMQAKLDEIDRERGEFKALAQRAQADLINFRKKIEDDRGEMIRSIATRLIIRLLPIVDDLQRALAQPPEGESVAWLDGIRLIERSLKGLLEAEGVTEIEACGLQFDPSEHEALFAADCSDKQPGIVISVIRPGYRLHGRVLRAAQVVVARDKETKQDEPSGSDVAQNPDAREA
ncbi:nucleotide exchange factor GrpE [Dehalococcoidia bacterium]|nr:nucleotide exchange factor GrpE [Dehalococcoidia bacterium]